ncbi:ribbon-helix-helix domain-containing protein [Pseudoxanthobacter sp.]|uniref:ribbon-helix-helix domain-containing protein n=1 Tax=Pseudoxanthobacter sp. TaxID=1925742 RepID=UPI002FDFDA34
MCRLFVGADPALWHTRTRSMRLSGVSTSLRLEDFYWTVLEEIAGRDGLSVGQLVSRLHDELAFAGGVDNFASFLRVCCGRYLHLQAVGAVPRDLAVPIRSLDAAAILAREAAARPVEA